MRRTGAGQAVARRSAERDDERLRGALCRAAEGGRWLHLLRLHASQAVRHRRAKPDRRGAQGNRPSIHRLSRGAAARGDLGGTCQTAERLASRRHGERPSAARCADRADADQSRICPDQTRRRAVEIQTLRAGLAVVQPVETVGRREGRVRVVEGEELKSFLPTICPNLSLLLSLLRSSKRTEPLPGPGVRKTNGQSYLF